MRTQAHRIVDTDPKRGNVVVRLFALIVFHLVIGWKVYRLSRGGVDSFGDTGRAVLFGDANAEKESVRASEAAGITEFTEETK